MNQKVLLSSFRLLGINVQINYCKLLRTTTYLKNYNFKMSGGPSSLNVTSTQKRSLDQDETDENWVKRIQLDPVVSEGEKEYVRRKLRKFVLLMSYCGKGYLGMQRNPGSKTIEDTLFEAMFKADLIKKEVISCPQTIRFQRAARTDKGVSAARQIVSMKLPGDVDIPSSINEHLPEEIRIIKAVRVTQKFDAKLQCDSRSYSYLTPTFAFAPIEVKTDESYRISQDVLGELRSILNIYKGTHNFHNFTARIKFNDRSAKRYIMNINCSDPFVREGLEFVLITVKGQSFMLHQIRKMVGLAMAICKGFTTRAIFTDVWKSKKIDIPIAPGLGLVLEEPHYDYYNKKYDDGFHEPLKWDSEEEIISEFRKKFIDSEIINTELTEKATLTWLNTLSLHTYDYRCDDHIHQREIDSKKNGILRAAVTLKTFRSESDECSEAIVNEEIESEEQNLQPIESEKQNLQPIASEEQNLQPIASEEQNLQPMANEENVKPKSEVSLQNDATLKEEMLNKKSNF